MKRRRTVPRIDAAALFAVDPDLALTNELWSGMGYSLNSGRLWRCKDGSWTVRLVWRKRGDIVGTVAVTLRGIGTFMASAVTP